MQHVNDIMAHTKIEQKNNSQGQNQKGYWRGHGPSLNR